MNNFTLEETQLSKDYTAFIVRQRQINDNHDHMKEIIKTVADGCDEVQNLLTTIYLMEIAQERIQAQNVTVPSTKITEH